MLLLSETCKSVRLNDGKAAFPFPIKSIIIFKSLYELTKCASVLRERGPIRTSHRKAENDPRKTKRWGGKKRSTYPNPLGVSGKGKRRASPPPANPALILVTSLQSPHPLPASVSNEGNSARKAPRHRSDSARSQISSRAASRSENWTDEGEKKKKKKKPQHTPIFCVFDEISLSPVSSKSFFNHLIRSSAIYYLLLVLIGSRRCRLFAHP